jgi:hypothetical protein
MVQLNPAYQKAGHRMWPALLLVRRRVQYSTEATTSIKAILDHAGIPSTGPQIAAARLPDSYFDAA